MALGFKPCGPRDFSEQFESSKLRLSALLPGLEGDGCIARGVVGTPVLLRTFFGFRAWDAALRLRFPASLGGFGELASPKR